MKATRLAGVVSALLLGIAPLACQAQMKIVLEDSARDAIGGRLAFAIKERIRTSAAFTLVPTLKEAIYRMSLVTLDDKSGYSTVYSVVFSAWQPETGTWTYLTNIVGTCGTNRITECADGLVADADKVSEEPKAFYRAYFSNQGNQGKKQ